ncbi:MAG: hypothetical protein LBI56_02435 [Puniceicoccales bacterium]|jgi:hypothetical protein|nr:hypothetical protein [Puniceicoccales bacterium]
MDKLKINTKEKDMEMSGLSLDWNKHSINSASSVGFNPYGLNKRDKISLNLDERTAGTVGESINLDNLKKGEFDCFIEKLDAQKFKELQDLANEKNFIVPAEKGADKKNFLQRVFKANKNDSKANKNDFECLSAKEILEKYGPYEYKGEEKTERKQSERDKQFSECAVQYLGRIFEILSSPVYVERTSEASRSLIEISNILEKFWHWKNELEYYDR